MASGTLTPTPVQTVLDANGNPVAGALINTYLAGTSTRAATYTDVGLTVANANPIVADSAGRYTAFLTPGASYKYVVTTAAAVAVWTADNIGTVPPTNINLDVTGTAGEAITAGQAVYLSDGSGGKTAGSWYKADSANTYSSTTAQIGMAPAAIASAASGTIRLAGQITGLSSLTVGTTYYVGTAGATTSTAPANRRVLGVADTTSSLVLTPNPQVGLFPDGTLSAPAISFSGDTDTGLYRVGTNNLALVTNGIAAINIDSTNFIDSATQPRCVAYYSTTQSLTSGAATAMILDLEDLDVGAMHDTVTNNTRITVPTGGDGLYWVRGSVFFAANATSYREVSIRKNGTTVVRLTSRAISAAADNEVLEVSWLGVMAATDYVELIGLQNSGGNLNAGSATRSNANELAVVKLW